MSRAPASLSGSADPCQPEAVSGEEIPMGFDIVEILDDYIAADNPRKWAKLASAVDSRRLELSVLREILVELRRLNGNLRGLASSGRAGE